MPPLEEDAHLKPEVLGANKAAAALDAAPIVPVIVNGTEYIKFKLPSGADAMMIAKGKGKHIKLALRMASNRAGDPGAMAFALIAVKCTIDGRALTLEDVDELEDFDVLALMGRVQGKASSAESTSPPSE